MKKALIIAILAALVVAPAVAFSTGPVELDLVGSVQYANTTLTKPENVKDFFQSLDYGVEVKADLYCFEGTLNAGFKPQDKVADKFYTILAPYFEYTLGFKANVGNFRFATGVGQNFSTKWVEKEGDSSKAKLQGVSFGLAPIIWKCSVDYQYNNIIFGASVKFVPIENFDALKSKTSNITFLNAISNPMFGIYCGISY